MSFAVQEALEERKVPTDASPDKKMREVIAWHLGDPSWWETIKEWMAEVGYKGDP